MYNLSQTCAILLLLLMSSSFILIILETMKLAKISQQDNTESASGMQHNQFKSLKIIGTFREE